MPLKNNFKFPLDSFFPLCYTHRVPVRGIGALCGEAGDCGDTPVTSVEYVRESGG